MPAQSVTVFGGTGFLGRRIVRHLRKAKFAARIASRHPDRVKTVVAPMEPTLEWVRGDVHDEYSIMAAVAGACAVVNAVSLYVERGRCTFRSVHVDAAARLASVARRAGVSHFIHISGIGADEKSASPYIRSRGQGEAAVSEAFPSATVVRPGVMFGPGDALLTPLLKMLRWAPAFPLFGSGNTRLQPVYAEDVAEAVTRILGSASPQPVYELAGPRIYTYSELLVTIAGSMGRRPLLVPVPFSLWRAVVHLAEALPNPPITMNQVDLMLLDNFPSGDAPGFSALQMVPEGIEKLLPEILGNIGRNWKAR